MQLYDAGIQTDLISMDFAKAFDTIPHQTTPEINVLAPMVWCAWESAQMDQQIFNKIFTESCSKRYLFCPVKVTSGVP